MKAILLVILFIPLSYGLDNIRQSNLVNGFIKFTTYNVDFGSDYSSNSMKGISFGSEYARVFQSENRLQAHAVAGLSSNHISKEINDEDYSVDFVTMKLMGRIGYELYHGKRLILPTIGLGIARSHFNYESRVGTTTYEYSEGETGFAFDASLNVQVSRTLSPFIRYEYQKYTEDNNKGFAGAQLNNFVIGLSYSF